MNLFTRQELAFVHQNAMYRLQSMLSADLFQQVRLCIKQRCRRRQTDTRAHLPRTKAIVNFRRVYDRTHAPFLVIICRLQQRRRLPCIHCGIVEIKLCHWSLNPNQCVIFPMSHCTIFWCGLSDTTHRLSVNCKVVCRTD
ncbi:hypothetical protein D3C85_1295040 [compost metagenome]